tara:strand:- start:40030 stop:40611 length:582 start_codon:yes stop_codon:yes gene_type:complete
MSLWSPSMGWSTGVPPQDLGLSASLFSASTRNVAWVQQTIDLSAYATHTIRLVWKVVNVGGNFANDLQLDTIVFDGTTYNFDTDIEGFSCMDAAASLAYDGASWVDVAADNTQGFWCRDQAGTTSGGTGTLTGQSGAFYIYTEASGPVTGDVFWLRSPQIVCSASAGNCTFYEGRDVVAGTTIDFYVDVDAQP